VKIRIEKIDDTIEIITEHPKGGKPNYIKNVSASYEVQMPQKANIDIGSTNGGINIYKIIGETLVKTTNGSVNISSCEGSIDAKTTNGQVHLDDVSGNVNINTSNGKISANIAMLDGESNFRTTNGSIDIVEGYSVPLEAQTTNGSITVGLPENFSADLQANTKNGKIYSELPINVQGEISKNSLYGKLNNGGVIVKLKTTNGKISIKRW